MSVGEDKMSQEQEVRDKLTGSIPALITPMKGNGKVDQEETERFYGWMDNKSKAHVVLGSTGEGVLMSNENRNMALECAQSALKKSCFIAGVSACATEQAIEMAKTAQKWQADMLLVTPPYYIKPNQNEI